MRFTWLLLLVVLLTDSCIEKLDVPVISVEPRLVVDGLITDQPGPHTIKLFLSSAPNEDLDFINYIGGATVKIVDDEGNTETLLESSKGVYQTSESYQGVIGRKYQLAIVTNEGKNYQSDFLEMYPPGEIQNISFEYKQNAINQTDLTKPQDVIEVYIDGTGVNGYSNLMRWRWRGTYQIKTYPELRVKITPQGEEPDPYECSGYIVNPVTGQLFKKRACDCCDCWVTEYSPSANVSKNDNISNISFNRIFLAQLPIDQFRFYFKYYIEAEQLSVSEDVHRFWKLIEAQQKGAGDLFQPNVVQVKGNVKSLNNPDEEVYGVFSVSAVAHKSIFIDGNDIPNPIVEVDTVIADCRYLENSSNQKPPFW